MLWSVYRNLVRRSVLKDEGLNTWTDESLLDFCMLSLRTFAAHTAVATSTVFQNATGTTFTLPENLYDVEPLADSGLIYFRQQSDGAKTYLAPSLYPTEKKGELLFTTWGNSLTLSEAPPSGTDLYIFHFAYYTDPVLSTDPVGIPNWAYPAFSLLMAAYSLTPVSVQSANISQWKVKSDSGNPEHNALRAQQRSFFEQYELELSRYPRQDRRNYYKALLP